MDDTIKPKISHLLYYPSEQECMTEIRKDLQNFYIILQRGDIIITQDMKVEAYLKFKKMKRDPNSGLSNASEDWFIRTQLQGWRAIPKRFVLPYGFTEDEIAFFSS